MNTTKTVDGRRITALLAATAIMLVLMLGGCDTFWMNVKELSGVAFTVDVYDNYGNPVTTMHGRKVAIEPTSTDKDGNADSSVLRITIDGDDVYTTGNTVVFTEDGLERVDDFETPKQIEGDGDGFAMFDRMLNDFANLNGKARMVSVSSQLGIPIAAYGGDEVEFTVPANLPKFTKLNIDGKALYIHRANYMVIDNNLL